MKQSFALVATKQNFTDNNLDDFSASYNLGKLKFKNEVKFSESQSFNFNEHYVDFYFGQHGTLAFFSSPAILEDVDLENSSFKNLAGAFWIDKKSNCARVNIYENFDMLINYVNINGKINQDIQNKQDLFNKDKFVFIVSSINWITKIDINNLSSDTKLRRYEILKETVEISNKASEIKSFIEKSKTIDKTSQPLVFEKIYNEDDNYVEETFLDFISQDDSLILKTLDIIPKKGTNKIINSYLVNLAFFHRDKKVRNKAKILIQNYLSETTFNQLNEKITSEHLKEQHYYWKSLVFFTELVIGEYILLASVTRRNYFSVYQAKGYNLYMDGRGNDIKKALDNSLPLGEIPNRIRHLNYLDYIRINDQLNLNVIDLLNKLSFLPNLKTLEISTSNLTEIPNELSKLLSLERLLINENPLKVISLKDELTNLKELDIGNTELQELNLKFFPQLTTLWVDSEEQFKRMNIFNNYKNVLITSGKYYKEILPKDVNLET